jgi:hypothetical protein
VNRPGWKDARNLLNEAQAGSEVIDPNDPSVILCTDPETNTKSTAGHYESGYAAFQATEKLKVRGGWPPGVKFEIVPIYPPRGEWA